MSANAPSDLKNLMEIPTAVTDPQLQGFLDTASLIVTEDLAGKGLTSARLKVIELYLAAHFAIQLTERGGLTSSKIDDSQDNYVSLSPLGNKDIGGFQLTRYGQQAIVLDTSNTLRTMSKSTLKAQLRVVTGLECD